MNKYNIEQIKERLLPLSTTIVSDALDAIGITNNAVAGIRPVWNCPAIVGVARTLRSLPAGPRVQQNHGSIVAAQQCKPGDIIVIGNGGDIENNSWGEVVTWAAKMKGAVGCICDGAVRDVDVIEQIAFPVYAKGITPRTGRGRMVLDSVNSNVRFVNTQVSPGDIVFADVNGIVFIPPELIDEVLEKAEEIQCREKAMIEKICKGANAIKVGLEGGYEDMLRESIPKNKI